MIYGEKDFYYNLITARRNADKPVMRSIIWGKVSELLATQKKDVIQALNDNNIPVATNASKKDLVNLLTDGLRTNKGLQGQIARLILYKEGFRFKKMNVDGSGDAATPIVTGSIAEAFNIDASTTDQVKAALIGAIDSGNSNGQTTNNGNNGSNGSGSGAHPLLVLGGVIVGTSVLIYFLSRE